MHLDVKRFNDSSDSAIRTATARAGLSHGASLELFYQSQNRDAILHALRHAGIPLQSSDRSSLTIKAEGLFQCTQIERALDVLKAAGFISDAFVSQISENFPNGHGGIQPFNNSHRTTLESLVSNYVPRALDILGAPIIDNTTSIEEIRPGVIVRGGLIAGEPVLNSIIDINRLLRGNRTIWRQSPPNNGRLHTVQQTPTTTTLVDVGKNANELMDAGFSGEIPDNYICPLSLSIMTEPVYLSGDATEQRFERSWINTWLTQKGTHPTTRVKFNLGSVEPDKALKDEIDGFVQTAIASPPSGFKK